jgi:hypothetical protein
MTKRHTIAVAALLLSMCALATGEKQRDCKNARATVQNKALNVVYSFRRIGISPFGTSTTTMFTNT